VKKYSFLLGIGLVFMIGCSDDSNLKKVKDSPVNREVTDVFNKLKAGMDNSELKKTLKLSSLHIEAWYPGTDGDIPKIDDFTTQDKLCFYLPKEIELGSGTSLYYPIDYANIIAVAIDNNKDCEKDSFYAKSLLLLSWKSHIHYDA
jgi:hypothetical protein